MKVILRKNLISSGKAITRGEKKEEKRGKKFEKKIFVIFVEMEVRNVGSAGTTRHFRSEYPSLKNEEKGN